MPEFSGFRKPTIQFLEELKANNSREWFTANKPRYESQVVEPSLEFIAAMAPGLRKISKHFDAIPKRTGGSLMRIYRDTRFAKDKTPYKTNIGIQFRHIGGKDVHAPGYYVHVEPDGLFVGVGMWHPDAEPLNQVRERIAAKPAEWTKALDAVSKRYKLRGDALARPPRGFDPEHNCIEDLKRKDFIAVASLTKRQVASSDLPEHLTTLFQDATPFMRFLCGAVEVSF